MSTIVNPEEFQRIRRLASKLYLGDEADDVVQDAVLAQLEGKRRSGTDSYVRQSLRFGLLSRARANQRRRRREAAYAAIDAARDQREVATIALALREALQRLSDDQRELLEARYVEDRTPSEIADELKISPEAARQRIHRALARLQAEFDDTAPQHRGLFVLAFGDLGRRRRIALAAALTALLAVPVAMFGTCDADHEQETNSPAAPTASLATPTATPPDGEVEAEHGQQAPPKTEQGKVAHAAIPDRLGAAVLLREYEQSSAQISKEVQGSFIECLTEHNQNPPPEPTPLSGRAEFRVLMAHDPDTGSFAEEVEVVTNDASARDLATCVRESLPTIRFEDPELVTPSAFRVVLDLDRRIAFAKAEIDLSDLPDAVRNDAELLDTLGKYLGREEPPPELRDAVADLATALADGVIAADELAPATVEALLAQAKERK